MTNHHELIQRLNRGDSSSYEDVVSWYASDILRLCYFLLRDKQEAEDVLQETMLKLIHMARTSKLKTNNGSIKGLLSTIARNLCIDRLRSRKPVLSISDSDDDPRFQMPSHHTPDRILDGKRFEDAFWNAVDQLNDTQRTVFVLIELQQESYTDTGLIVNISTDAVRQHFYRARKQLIQILKPYLVKS